MGLNANELGDVGLLEEKHKQDPNSTLPAKSSAGGHKDKPDDHHGGLWTGSHKSGLTMHKVKEKLHLGKHHGS